MESTHEWHPSSNPWLIAVVTILPTFMVVLDTSVANVSLPHIAGSLSATNDEATWVLTSYLVSNAIILPITGWLSQYFERKRFLILSIIAFTASSVICGTAFSLGMIIFGRVIQGASGGALVPLSQAILLESFPPALRGEAMAVFGLGVIVAPVVGPTLGGWITDNYSWHWVFYINVPVGILAVFLTRMLIEDPPYLKDSAPGTVDYPGFLMMAVGLGTLQIVLDKGQNADWFGATWICWFSVISVVCLLAFLAWELRARDPVVNLRILANRNFAIGTFMGVIYGVILYGTLVMLPLFLQSLMGYTALDSGLCITPRGLGAVLSVVVAGRIVGKVDGRILIAMGFLGLAFSAFLFGNITLEISMSSVIWPNFAMGLAMGFIFVPMTTISMATLPNQQIGTATGLYSLMRSLGGSIGIAVVTSMIARDAQFHQALMVSHLTPYDPQFQNWLKGVQDFLATRVDPVTALRQAYMVAYRTLIRQATLWAYIDNFRFLAFLSLCGVPMTLLFKKIIRKHGTPGSVAE